MLFLEMLMTSVVKKTRAESLMQEIVGVKVIEELTLTEKNVPEVMMKEEGVQMMRESNQHKELLR